jgi:hypothetical protein
MTTLALQITTNGEVRELDSLELETLQNAVGGWVQAISLRPDLTMWMNEESKINGLPHNPVAQSLWDNVYGKDTDYISGDVVFTGGTDDNGESIPLGGDVAKRLREIVLERYIRVKS